MLNNCNFNKINPSSNGKFQQIKYINTPNYFNSKKTNSAINLNKLNIPSNNQSKNNKIPSNYNSYAKLTLNSNNLNYFSPHSQKSNGIENNININNLQMSENNNIKNISSSLLNYEKTKNIAKIKKKLLVLDLDETLVHSRFSQFKIKSDIILNINIDGRDHIIHVLKRPYLAHFLKEISKYFEILIFTASIPQYASPLLDELDTEKIFNRRLFREHCISYNGLYLKDLKQIGEDLKNMIIIDNNPASYALNQDNGIPILTWYDNINDNELNKLIPLLKYLSNVDDVRPIIKEIVDREKMK
jgi:Dullard-like phosphatase family protein